MSRASINWGWSDHRLIHVALRVSMLAAFVVTVVMATTTDVRAAEPCTSAAIEQSGCVFTGPPTLGDVAYFELPLTYGGTYTMFELGDFSKGTPSGTFLFDAANVGPYTSYQNPSMAAAGFPGWEPLTGYDYGGLFIFERLDTSPPASTAMMGCDYGGASRPCPFIFNGLPMQKTPYGQQPFLIITGPLNICLVPGIVADISTTGCVAPPPPPPPPACVIELPDVINQDRDGGLVVLNADDNGAPRARMIIEHIAGYSGSVEVTSDSTKIAIYDAATGGSVIANPAFFANSSLPLTLYVEGQAYSDAMRDISITASGDGNSCTVKFTVLWVDQPQVNGGSSNGLGVVSPDDPLRDLYVQRFGPALQSGGYSPDALGVPIIENPTPGIPNTMHLAYGVEGRAMVHPADFSYPGVNFGLDRAVANYQSYKATIPGLPPFVQTSGPTSMPSVPAGNDHGPDQYYSNDPLLANGFIYNLDAPGTLVPIDVTALFNVTFPVTVVPQFACYRSNFLLFADLILPPTGADRAYVRASPIAQYRVDEEWKAEPLIPWEPFGHVPGDNMVAPGALPVFPCPLVN